MQIHHTNIDKFLQCVMKNEYTKEENDSVVKYHNKYFDVLVQKRKDSKKNDSCIVIDKRQQPIIYNDIAIALDRLCTQ
jgi:D-serine dehydratase